MLYVKHYNNTQPNLIMHYISHSISPPLHPHAPPYTQSHNPSLPPPSLSPSTPLPPPPPTNKTKNNFSQPVKMSAAKSRSNQVQHPMPVKGLELRVVQSRQKWREKFWEKFRTVRDGCEQEGFPDIGNLNREWLVAKALKFPSCTRKSYPLGFACQLWCHHSCSLYSGGTYLWTVFTV